MTIYERILGETPNVRKATQLLHAMADEGLISWENIGRNALAAMSEDDVEAMAREMGLLTEEID